MHIISLEILPCLLSILLTIMVASFIVSSNIITLSEGQKQIPSIRITSPITGENISTNSTLTISGVATGINNPVRGADTNWSGISCHVSVIVNNIKPYHNATAYGPNGENDYSKWGYLSAPGDLKQGQNKITAKLDCQQTGTNGTKSTRLANTPPKMIKWYSVNVTGVSTSAPPIKSNQTISNSTLSQSQQQKQPSNAKHNTTATPTAAAPHNIKSNRNSSGITNENNSNGVVTSGGILLNLTKTPSTYRHNNNAKTMSLSVESSQNIVNGKGTSVVKAIANDAATGKKIGNATVKLKIIFISNGTSKVIVGHYGEVTYTAELKPKSNNNNNNSNLSFNASAQASAPGYVSTKTASSSISTSSSTSTITSNNTQNSTINSSSSNANNLTQSILTAVQNKLKENGVDVPLN